MKNKTMRIIFSCGFLLLIILAFIPYKRLAIGWFSQFTIIRLFTPNLLWKFSWVFMFILCFVFLALAVFLQKKWVFLSGAIFISAVILIQLMLKVFYPESQIPFTDRIYAKEIGHVGKMEFDQGWSIIFKIIDVVARVFCLTGYLPIVSNIKSQLPDPINR